MSTDAARVPGRVKFLVCVDRRPQSRVAVAFAALRTRNTRGSIALLHVIKPPEFHHFAAIGDRMEAERREDAEDLVRDLADEVVEYSGITPEIIIREGRVGDEILAQVAEDESIDLLVIGAAAPDDKSFSLITYLAGKLVGKLMIPLVVVPGNLSRDELEAMT